MRFGKTLQRTVYAPWRDHYIDYDKLKHLLRESSADSDRDEASSASPSPSSADREWTERDESAFVEELVNVQLEKVHAFQVKMNAELNERTARCEQRLEKLVPGSSGGEYKPEERREILEQTLKELDEVTKYINELERFSRINFTGFLKAAKKHDRRYRGVVGERNGKGKGKEVRGGGPKVRPLLQVRLGHLEFNKEDYSPLIYRLSTMYDFVRRNMNGERTDPVELRSSVHPGTTPNSKTYTSHKFWVHPDNIIEVKTFVLRRLPVLVYNPHPSKNIEFTGQDPTITSLYFDNPKFELYTDKVLKNDEASSMRLRWYGHLSEAPEIFLERKTVGTEDGDAEGALEERIALKQKYVDDFINGRYALEKTVRKMKEWRNAEEVDKYQAQVTSLQEFITEKDLQPVLRASYTRTAFQIPGDNRIRINLDTDLALIREDALDTERPCRDPDDWHRGDIDDANMEFPFTALRKGEISRFPYALLDIKVRDSELRSRSREWVHELVTSHLVHGAPRFSKFVHGVAVLFDDYVNSLPFWLGDMEEDIRKDPRKAWDVEQERLKKQIEDEAAVGSFHPTASDFGGRGTAATPPKGSLGDVTRASPRRTSVLPPDTKMLPTQVEAEVVEEESDEEPVAPRRTASTLDNLRQLFPGFSTSRYGRAHSAHREITLPPGVQKPRQLLMYAGEVKVEAKVWLANQRTFIKWMHITVLLASLSVGLYNAVGPGNTLAQVISMVYTGLAVFAGVWGWTTYMWRTRLIEQRSGKDFDHVLGPIVVCVALAVALVVNFVFKYHTAMVPAVDRGNATTASVEGLVDMVGGGEL